MATVTRKWDVCAGRKYEQRGETKTHWVNVGRAVEFDGEQISIELHAMPVFPGWTGKLSLFVPRDKESAKPATKAQQDDAFDDDSIPF